MKILAIESSCDDSSVAIIDDNTTILAHKKITQNHKKFGGVFPEQASRLHSQNIPKIVQECLDLANITIHEIDIISSTLGPGLIGSLLVGTTYAKTLAALTHKPWIGVDHLEGHILTPCWTNNIDYPFGVLLLSGGHTLLCTANQFGDYTIYGETYDDAVGEALDKIGRELHMNTSAGPEIEQYAKIAKNPVKFTIPLHKDNTCNFSLSGLKTNVIRIIKTQKYTTADICAGVQETILKMLYERLYNLWQHINVRTWLLVGGVAANRFFLQNLQEFANKYSKEFVAPPIEMCTDNAIMIAYCAQELAKRKIFTDLRAKPYSRCKFPKVTL